MNKDTFSFVFKIPSPWHLAPTATAESTSDQAGSLSQAFSVLTLERAAASRTPEAPRRVGDGKRKLLLALVTATLDANARAESFFATLDRRNRYAILFRIQNVDGHLWATL
jgi:hypothetical protein